MVKFWDFLHIVVRNGAETHELCDWLDPKQCGFHVPGYISVSCGSFEKYYQAQLAESSQGERECRK